MCVYVCCVYVPVCVLMCTKEEVVGEGSACKHA